MSTIIKVLKKFIMLLSLLCIATSCSQETEKTVLEKSKLMLTSDVRENDTFIFNGQKYIINEMYTSKLKIGKPYKYNRHYIFKDGLDFGIHSDNPDNLSEYEIDISRGDSCFLIVDYIEKGFFIGYVFANRKNITSDEATELLLQLYNGKDWNDICRSYSKEIKL